MANINVTRDSKLIKVLADQARGLRVDTNNVQEAADIINELASDLNPQNRHEIAQTVAFTVDEMQRKQLDFLNQVADIKNINYGDKAAFNVKTRGIKSYIQAKGSTTPRSYVAGKQIFLETDEISARPAISLMDLRTGRVSMADLIKSANDSMTEKKLQKVEAVLQGAISEYAAPFYGTGTGVTKGVIDPQINHFMRLGGRMTILGDHAAVSQLSGLVGMNGRNSDSQIDEYNRSGFIGNYIGADVVAMQNTYEEGSTTPVLKTNWLYMLPAGVTADMKNLKIVNEGSVQAMENQDINDRTYEILLDQWFGAGFVVGEQPTIGAYVIN